MKKYGPISTVSKDCVVPKPGPKQADGASFGNALSGEGPAPTKGEMGEVQFSDMGPKPGTRQDKKKIAGGGSY